MTPIRENAAPWFARTLMAQTWIVGLFSRYPWAGWAIWAIFCANSLIRTNPRRFGSTFQAYLDAANHFWHAQPVYTLSNLGEYLYWPVSLLVLGPLMVMPSTLAAAVAMGISAAALTWASVVFLKTFLPNHPTRETFYLAGVLLMINIPGAWYNFKYVQAQIGMTAFMMLGAAAITRQRWALASLWLFFSIIIKPLALVMLLLCAAAERKMRLGLAIALAVAVGLPFAFADYHYVVDQYRMWFIKLEQLASVVPGQWVYQADFATMLDTFGIDLPHGLQTAVRLLGALATLVMVLRLARFGNTTVFAMGVTLFAGCYITLFGPRNEFLSFLVLEPPLTALALVLMIRDTRDQRAWLLIAAVLIIGFHGALEVDRALKPFITVVILSWLVRLTWRPRQWVLLLQPASTAPPVARGASVP